MKKIMMMMVVDPMAMDWRILQVSPDFAREKLEDPECDTSNVRFIPIEMWSSPSPNYVQGRFDA